jgi:hypothetical protein
MLLTLGMVLAVGFIGSFFAEKKPLSDAHTEQGCSQMVSTKDSAGEIR